MVNAEHLVPGKCSINNGKCSTTMVIGDLASGIVVKKLLANAGNMSLIPGKIPRHWGNY